jgi:glycosyltransferase involved in cell wall biosynthesis
MSNYFDIVGVSSEGKDLKKVTDQEGIRCVPINMSRKLTPFQDIISLMQMIMLIRNENPDMVHSHTPKAGIIAMLAAFICKVPSRLHTVAGLPSIESRGLKRHLLLLIDRLTCKLATKVYPNSNGLKKILIQVVKVPEAKLKVLGYGSSNGVDTDFFNPYEDDLVKIIKKDIYNNYESFFNFIFIGRIVKDKGIEELIDSFSRLSNEFSNIKLFILGEREELLDPISKGCEDGLMNKNIVMTGYEEDIRPYLKISDCLVLPSYREGFPNVVLQAACMGVPSIVSDINGCNEIITSEFNGLIVPPKNKNQLYLAMRRLILNKPLVSKMSTLCRKSVINRFDRKDFHNLILDEYKKILNTKHND